MPAADVGGRQLAYADSGSGPAVVLVHGLLMDHTMWDHQAEGLRDAYRVVTIDAPGHGDSDPVEVGYDFPSLAHDVWTVCDRLGIEEAVLGGQSFGGWTGILGALARPEKVRGLILVDTTAEVENPETLPMYEGFLQVALEDGISEDLNNAVFPILFSAPFAGSLEGEAWRKKLLDFDVHRALAIIRAVFDRPSSEDRLPQLRVPAVVIHGEEDVAISIEKGQRLAQALGAPLVRVPGAGHASPVEQPAIVTQAIRTFLDGLG